MITRLQRVTAQAWIDDVPVVVEVDASEQLRQMAHTRYFLLEYGVDAGLPVPTIMIEGDLDAAAERFLLPGLLATNPYPPCVPVAGGGYAPPDTLVPGLKIALGRNDRCYVVGVADWPPERPMTHGELWGFFGPEEIAFFRRAWHGMAQALDFLEAHGHLPEWAV